MKNIVIVFLITFLSACSGERNDWQDLFNEKNLDGWHLYGDQQGYNGWTVEQGVLVYDPALRNEAQSAYLVTDKEYENFELSFDWMVSENGNSGVFWAVIENDQYEYPYQTGPEIQILDDGWEEYIAERGDINRAGSLYNLLAPSKIVSKPQGQWNSYLLHVDHTKNIGWLDFNGERVLDFPVHGEAWQKLIDESGFAGWKGFGQARKGKISLQDHGSKVAFRAIKIRELNND